MPIKQLPSGAFDIAVCVNRRRVHRVLPAGTSARDARRFESELVASLARKEPSIPGDPSLTELMAAYMRHADTLKAPKPAKYHAARIGRWAAGYRASQARQCAAAIIQDLVDKMNLIIAKHYPGCLPAPK